MEYRKEFKSYKEQLKLLEERGIKFNIITIEEAEKIISSINYYKFSGYIKVFEIETDRYDIEFNKIYELYKFDRKLASYVFEMVEKIEVAFKTKLIYNILERTKELGPFGYLETTEWKDYSFEDKETGNSRMKKFRDILKDKMEFKKRVLEFTMRDIKPYIENYFKKYKKVLDKERQIVYNKIVVALMGYRQVVRHRILTPAPLVRVQLPQLRVCSSGGRALDF